MTKVELSLKEKQKYEIIKKLVETNGNKEDSRIKLGLKSILFPRARKITKKNLKKKLIAQKEKAKSKKEVAKLQASIIAIEDAHPRQPRCLYF